jgi:hypothetical protein
MNYQKEKSIPKALTKTCKTVFWFGYLMVYQKIAKNLVVVKKNEYDVHYIYHGQLYKIKCILPQGPQKLQVLMVTNDKLEDVTSSIMPYMGPKQNFHNQVYRTKDFGEKELSFYLSNGDILTFDSEKSIIIKDNLK